MATVVKVKLHNLAEEIENFSRAHVVNQKAAVARGLARSIAGLVDASPVDTGLYSQSWDFTVDEKKAVIGNFAPHAPIIESGARPFTPPLAPLLAWAKRVLQDPSQPPDYSPAVMGLALGTQRKISREGMKPRHILEKQLPAILDNIRAEFEGMQL